MSNRAKKETGNAPDKDVDVFDNEDSGREHQLSTFSEVGKALTSTLDTQEVLNVVMEQTTRLLRPENWSLLLLDEESKELRFELTVGSAAEKLKDLKLKLGEGVAGWVVKEGKALFIPDVKKDARFAKKAELISEFNTESIICVPLKVRGKCLGAIELINTKKDHRFSKEDMTLLHALADYTAIAIENSKLFVKVQELTITDDLTGLYNSRHLHNSLHNEIARSNRFESDLSMIFLDLDYFKAINDEHGHLCGSKLLKEVGALILDTVRNVDIAFRYGGDEFVVLMPQTTKKNALTVAEKIRSAFKKSTFLNEEGIACNVTASFGLATYPGDAKNEAELIHLADVAMYRVKNRSRDGVETA